MKTYICKDELLLKLSQEYEYYRHINTSIGMFILKITNIIHEIPCMLAEDVPQHEYTINEYQHEASRTINHELTPDARTMHAVFGLCSEAGEVAGIMQKRYQGHPVDVNKIVDEAGDVLWFLQELCHEIDIPLENVARHNIEKLKKRYKGEGFTENESVNREEYKNANKG